MKRVLLVVFVLLLVVPLTGFFLLRRAAQERLAARDTGLEALRHQVLPRPTKEPRHDNGLACLGRVASVRPPNPGPFNLEQPHERWGQVLAVTRGEKPFDALSPEDQEAFVRLAPWAESMRECASSALLRRTDDFDPAGSPQPFSRHRAAVDAFESYGLWQGVELRRLLIDGAPPEVVVDRCTAALALAADVSNLGPNARGTVATSNLSGALAPLCAQAFGALPKASRKAVAETWAALPGRLIKRSELVRYFRYGQPVRFVAAPLPGEEKESPLAWLTRQRQWRAWDAGLSQLEGVADGDAAARDAALASARALLTPFHEEGRLDELGYAFTQVDRAEALLTLLVSIAVGDTAPRPHVTREASVLRYAAPGQPPVELPLPKD